MNTLVSLLPCLPRLAESAGRAIANAKSLSNSPFSFLRSSFSFPNLMYPVMTVSIKAGSLFNFCLNWKFTNWYNCCCSIYYYKIMTSFGIIGVWGLGFGVWGLGFGVWGLGFG